MKRAALSLFVVMSAGSAIAQEAAVPGRFSFVPVTDGALRLDTETGAVALCAEINAAFSCTPVNDGMVQGNAAAGSEERIAALEARVAALEERGVLLDDEAMDRVAALAEGMMRNFFDMVGEMRREFEGDTP